MENPPHLPDEVLQKLLAEAQFPLSTRLGGVDEHDDSSPVEGKSNLIVDTILDYIRRWWSNSFITNFIFKFYLMAYSVHFY